MLIVIQFDACSYHFQCFKNDDDVAVDDNSGSDAAAAGAHAAFGTGVNTNEKGQRVVGLRPLLPVACGTLARVASESLPNSVRSSTVNK